MNFKFSSPEPGHTLLYSMDGSAQGALLPTIYLSRHHTARPRRRHIRYNSDETDKSYSQDTHERAPHGPEKWSFDSL